MDITQAEALYMLGYPLAFLVVIAVMGIFLHRR